MKKLCMCCGGRRRSGADPHAVCFRGKITSNRYFRSDLRPPVVTLLLDLTVLHQTVTEMFEHVLSRYLCCGAGSGVSQSAAQREHPTAVSGGQRRTAGSRRLSVQPAARQRHGTSHAPQSTTYPMIQCRWLTDYYGYVPPCFLLSTA